MASTCHRWLGIMSKCYWELTKVYQKRQVGIYLCRYPTTTSNKRCLVVLSGTRSTMIILYLKMPMKITCYGTFIRRIPQNRITWEGSRFLGVTSPELVRNFHCNQDMEEIHCLPDFMTRCEWEKHEEQQMLAKIRGRVKPCACGPPTVLQY